MKKLMRNLKLAAAASAVLMFLIAVDDELVDDSRRGTANKWIKCVPIDLHHDDN